MLKFELRCPTEPPQVGIAKLVAARSPPTQRCFPATTVCLLEIAVRSAVCVFFSTSTTLFFRESKQKRTDETMDLAAQNFSAVSASFKSKRETL